MKSVLGYRRGVLEISDRGRMPYVELGKGDTPIVLIPGAGDGLATAFDKARSLAWFYRKRVADFRLLVLSRRQPIPSSYTVEQHVEDYIRALEKLDWRSAVVECNSAGGPIGQQIAARRPDLVRGLILASTAHRMDEQAQRVILRWLELIREENWGEFAWDSSVKTYRSLRGWLKPLARPLLGLVGRPRDPERIERLLLGLLGVDNREVLPCITCPTLVFGGEQDPVLSAGLQREMAELIPNSSIHLCSGYLHGADLESPEYLASLKSFVRQLS